MEFRLWGRGGQYRFPSPKTDFSDLDPSETQTSRCTSNTSALWNSYAPVLLCARVIASAKFNMKEKMKGYKGIAAATLTDGSLLVGCPEDGDNSVNISVPKDALNDLFSKIEYLPLHALYAMMNQVPCPDCGKITDQPCTASFERAVIFRDGKYLIAQLNVTDQAN